MSGGDRILGSPLVAAPGGGATAGSSEADVAAQVQAVLDGVSGQVIWMLPIRDEAGEIVDFEVRAVSAAATDVYGRVGKGLLGLRMADSYPSLVRSSLWDGLLRVMETGEPEECVRHEQMEEEAGVTYRSVFTARLARVADGALLSWVQLEGEERLKARLAHTERLGNLGWTYMNLVTGDADWSEQLYVILGRDPRDGPLDLERFRAMVHPEDSMIMDRALAALARKDEPHDFEVRVRVRGGLRLIRMRIEPGRDSSGRLVEIHGVLQDVTDRRHTADQLADVRQRLEEESRLTAHLQNIILPAQEDPYIVPGVEVAVRYDPAETAPLGGDWYQAVRLDDDEVLLAVGDVAGHGLSAASAMAKLRHAITGLAFVHHGPDQILVALNRLLRRMRPDVLATAVVAHYRHSTRTLTWSHAGHPPMLLVRGSRVERLMHAGVLLGAFEDVNYTCASVRLEPEDLLLMFTDGLIESPGRDLFDGLARLSSTVTAVVRAEPADRLSAVMGNLVPSNTRDDTCVLVARFASDRVGSP